MSVIKPCPYCGGDSGRYDCDYCDQSGLMDLNEIARAELDIQRREDEDDEDN